MSRDTGAKRMAAAARRPKPYRQEPAELAREAFYSPWTPTEAEMTDLFLHLADRSGWAAELRYHVNDSRRSQPGYPDWTMVHPEQRRILFVELKGFGGEPTHEQRRWVRAINAAGGEACVLSTTGDYAQDAMAMRQLLTQRLPPVRRPLQR